MILVHGKSHAAQHLRMAAKVRDNHLTELWSLADVFFFSEDTPTDERGIRDQESIAVQINGLLRDLHATNAHPQIVVTSQVTPGFTRALQDSWKQFEIFHQPETLRMKDAVERALLPDYIMVGGPHCPNASYMKYLMSFSAQLHFVSWEDAEFSKIAVNMTLAAQVESATQLAKEAATFGADWENVCKALRSDKRIGPHSYLQPGRWQDSLHLLRDYRTLEALRDTSQSS